MSRRFRDRWPARAALATARWLAPSVAAAAIGTLAAGAVELVTEPPPAGGDSGGDGFAVLATIGFLAMLAAPALVVGAACVRGVVAAWRPRAIAERVIEAGGGAPALAAWVAILWLAALGMASSLFQSVWMFSSDTAWKPNTVSIALPAIAVAVIAAMAALTVPVHRGLCWLIRRVDARWRRRGWRSLVTPWRIVGFTIVATVAAIAIIWTLLIKKRIGPIDLSLLYAPAAGVVACALAHAGWRWLPARRGWRAAIAGGLAAIVVGAIACAFSAARTAPSLTLSIWGDRPLAGLAVDRLFSLDRIRDEIPLSELAPTTPIPGAPHPDIVLVTIDTVRADHTPPYGGKAEMPALASLARDGLVFDWAFSPSNVTRRSIPSLSIGLAANRVRGRVVGWALKVDPRHVLLAEHLREGGYDTAGFMCCGHIWGPDFDTGLDRGIEHLELEANGNELARRARAWVVERDRHSDRKPLFLWMHILEPHNWKEMAGDNVSDDEKKRFYDRALALSDSALATLVSGFAQRDPAHAPIIIVTADHGEGMGDHGQLYHSTDLYDSQTHVPLVMTGPGIRTGRIDETVSGTDLVPTILELAGFQQPPPGVLDGRSIADLATGKRPAQPDAGDAFMTQIKDRSNPGGISAVVRGRFKLISNNGSLELYDTRADPDEKVNLVHMPVRRKLVDELTQLLAKYEALGDVSPFR